MARRPGGLQNCKTGEWDEAGQCRGRFGLIRYTAYRAFGSIIQFCCKKCERAYFDERRKEAQWSRYRDSDEANFPHITQ